MALSWRAEHAIKVVPRRRSFFRPYKDGGSFLILREKDN